MVKTLLGTSMMNFYTYEYVIRSFSIPIRYIGCGHILPYPIPATQWELTIRYVGLEYRSDPYKILKSMMATNIICYSGIFHYRWGLELSYFIFGFLLLWLKWACLLKCWLVWILDWYSLPTRVAGIGFVTMMGSGYEQWGIFSWWAWVWPCAPHQISEST